MLHPRLVALASAVCLAVLILAGCGQSNPLGRLALSGTVQLQGQPLDQGSIEFSPLEGSPKVTSGGPIQEGRFEIVARQGLPPGTYRVRIFSADPSAAGAEPEFPGEHTEVRRDRIPPEWNANSDKQITVTEDGPNEFEFDVK